MNQVPQPLPPEDTGLGAITLSELLLLGVGAFLTIAVGAFLIIMLVRNQVKDR
ncbi:MAG: hypothetical protein MK116_05355 [Phycisphaerales bacterium]|nr:hypothetical protein [Phycisphaerales bacterium]